MKLKSDEFLILAVLCDGELHGNGIMRAVFRMTKGGLMLRSAGLYGVLGRLANRGLLEQVKRPNEQAGGTGVRTYYLITPAGRRIVEEEADARSK